MGQDSKGTPVAEDYAAIAARLRELGGRSGQAAPRVECGVCDDRGWFWSGAALDWRRYVFINVDLTVHLQRLPEGEWVCLDAVTLPEPSGVGLSDTLLCDERGRIGRALQTLLVGER